MKKLSALARAALIVLVAVLPGVGAVFTMSAGDRMQARARLAAPPPPERTDLVGTYVADSASFEGELRLAFVPTTHAPRGTAPILAAR
jgi:hypothetical protein